MHLLLYPAIANAPDYWEITDSISSMECGALSILHCDAGDGLRRFRAHGSAGNCSGAYGGSPSVVGPLPAAGRHLYWYLDDGSFSNSLFRFVSGERMRFQDLGKSSRARLHSGLSGALVSGLQYHPFDCPNAAGPFPSGNRPVRHLGGGDGSAAGGLWGC